MTKEFKILSIKKRNAVENYTDVISVVTYEVVAIEDGISVNYVGVVGLPLPSNNFTDFNSLTEDQVIGWVRSVINEQKLDELLQKLIIKQKYPEPEEAELPWK